MIRCYCAFTPSGVNTYISFSSFAMPPPKAYTAPLRISLTLYAVFVFLSEKIENAIQPPLPPSLSESLRVNARAEQRSSQADHIAAVFHAQLPVSAHAHGQMFDIRILAAQAVI